MLQKFLNKKILFYFLIVVALVITFFLIFNKGDNKQAIIVSRSDLVQEVSATGKVKPNQSVDLSFDQTGRVARVNFEVGYKVKKGEEIVSLDTSEISANLSKARALLAEEQIKLKNTEEVAPSTYNDASRNLEAAIRSSFADADDAVRNKADQFFKSSAANPQFEISITSGNFTHYFIIPSDLVVDINGRRQKIENILNDWEIRNKNINSQNLVSNADKAINDLDTITNFLDKMASAVNSFSPAEYAYETTVSNYKTTISGARTEVSSAVSSLVTAKDKLNSAPTLGQGGEFDTVSIQKAKVAQASSALESLEASLSGSIIRAPFDGVITVQDAKVGSTVSVGSKVVSMISENDMYIEANISEVNIGKIKVGNNVVITMDAFPDETFNGFVSFVEPGDVLVDGIVNYKIRVSFGNTEIAANGQEIWRYGNIDSKIKSGLTSNLKIQTNKKESVLVIPNYAVIKEGEDTFVNKLIGKKVIKTKVSLGISGNSGYVEVLEGLKEGDSIKF